MAVLNPVSNARYLVYLFDSMSFPSQTDAASTVNALAAGANITFQLVKSQLFGAFSSVHGLNAGIDVESYDEGGRPLGSLQFPKRGKYEPLQLERGVTFAPELWDWQYQVLMGSLPPIRKDGVVILADGPGLSGSLPTPLNLPIVDFVPVAIWIFTGGLPSKMELSDLSATGTSIAIEKMTITHEGLFRLGTAQIPFVGDVATRLTA